MAETTTTSNRRCDRKSKTMPVSLIVKDDPSSVDTSAFTLDISLMGASIRTKLPLHPGERIGFVPPGDISTLIPARAVWVREDKFMWTYAGLEFLDAAEGN